MKIKEVANLVGISVRTLHHYDDIGLLKPETVTPSGYRMYSNENLETLQQILFFKELDFPLKRIKNILNSPSFDRKEALQLHRSTLLEKRRRIDNMIATIDKTTQYMQGEISMTNKEIFAGFDFSKNDYELEARERWGDEAVDKSNATLNTKSGTEQTWMGEEMNAIFHKLASLTGESPASDKAQSIMQEWYDFLNQTGYHYSLEAFQGLGEMYISDLRFTKNIDQFGDGLAKFMRDAMVVYVKNNK